MNKVIASEPAIYRGGSTERLLFSYDWGRVGDLMSQEMSNFVKLSQQNKKIFTFYAKRIKYNRDFNNKD